MIHQNCKHLLKDRHYTEDSFEYEFTWKCDLLEGKQIADWVGHWASDEEKVETPD